MTKVAERKTNHTIDSFRLIAALLVVFSHTALSAYDYRTSGGAIYFIIMAFMRLAVPLFFITSGYFSFSEKNNSRKLLASAANLIKTFLKVEIVFAIFLAIIKGGVKPVISTFYPEIFSDLVFYNAPFFNFSLWFILALAYVKIIYVILQKVSIKNIELWCLAVAFIVWLTKGPMVIPYGPATNTSVVFVINFFAMGWIYFAIGRCVCKYQKIILSSFTNSEYKKYLLWGLFLYLVEYAILLMYFKSAFDHYLMTPIVTSLIFIFMLNNPNSGKGTIIPSLGKKYSFAIYIWHLLFFRIVEAWFLNSGYFGKGIKEHLIVVFVVAGLIILSLEVYLKILQFINSQAKRILKNNQREAL